MPQMRIFSAPWMRRATSGREILSPAYSAILRPLGKCSVAKQPWSLIFDLRTVIPDANFCFIQLYYSLRLISGLHVVALTDLVLSDTPITLLHTATKSKRFHRLLGSVKR